MIQMLKPDERLRDRDLGLDVARIIAFMSVLSVHFFRQIGFYSMPVAGLRMYVMTIMRTLFMVCVPLFMLLSGYLMSKKEIVLNRKGLWRYYSKISNIIITYVLATSIILIYRIFYLKEALSFKDCILNILAYEQYSWYVNMYINFYFLVPFLNVLWNNIKNKEGQLFLIAALLCMTALPSLFNIWDFQTPGALMHPSISKSYRVIVPNRWVSVYPITYYYIGAYLRKNVNMKELRTGKVFAAFIGTVLCFGIFNIWRCKSVNFIWGLWCDWGAIQNVVDATLLFLVINSIRYPQVNPHCTKFIGMISKLTFGAYLVSWVPDNLCYSKLNSLVLDGHLRLDYFPVMVGINSVISLMLSLVVWLVAELVRKALNQGIVREN